MMESGDFPSLSRPDDGVVSVETRSGLRGEPEPALVVIQDMAMDVLGIDDRWYDEAATYFRVRIEDGSRALLRHDMRRDLWSVVQRTWLDA